MRVMIDTNILLSAVLFPSERMDGLIRKAAVESRLVLSSYVIDELFDVIRRKFPNQKKAADTFLSRIPYELVYTPKQPDLGLFDIRDPDDYVVFTACSTYLWASPYDHQWRTPLVYKQSEDNYFNISGANIL